MQKHISRKIAAGLLAAAMAVPVAASMPVTLTASADQLLVETDFSYKIAPWHPVASLPAKQNFMIDDGALHITVLVGEGADGAKWDLQVRHRDLYFKKDHTYKVSCKVRAKRAGMEICSMIGNTKGDEEYFDLKDGEFIMGPAMSGEWGNAVKLTTEYQTFEGTFIPTKDLDSVEWRFEYGMGSKKKYGGNAQEGDELWFDDMSIECVTCDECGPSEVIPGCSLPGRDSIRQAYNYISVNQLGYYTDAAKIAVLGDNKGSIFPYTQTISLQKDKAYDYEIVDNASGTVVYTGKTDAAKQDKDSNDTVCKIDFSTFEEPGEYYIRIKDKQWRSLPFRIGSNIYKEAGHDMLTNALNYFYLNRSGIDIKSAYVTSGNTATLAHQGGHKKDSASVQNEWVFEYSDNADAQEGGQYYSKDITANRGWYNGGDYGKYVTGSGVPLWTLQNLYEWENIESFYSAAYRENGKFAEGSGTVVVPEDQNDIPDLLDECKYELDFMQSMKVTEDDPAWGEYAGLYYSKVQDSKWVGLAAKPWDYDGPKEEGGWDTVRIVKPPTFAATLNYAACAAQAARLWERYDRNYAAELLQSAKEAYAAYKQYFYYADSTVTTHPIYYNDCRAEEINPKSLYAPVYHQVNGSAYGDFDVSGEAYWAACELFITAKELDDADADSFYTDLCTDTRAFQVLERVNTDDLAYYYRSEDYGSFTSFYWNDPFSLGSLSLSMHDYLLDQKTVRTLDESILEVADRILYTEEEQGYGIPYTYDGPGYGDSFSLQPNLIVRGYEQNSNGRALNNMIVLAYAYDRTGEEKYRDGVISGMNYLLGCNPLSFSYITGYGQYGVKFPHHPYWSYQLDMSLPQAPDGVVVSGPNAGLQDDYVRLMGFMPGREDCASQRCYADNVEAWSVNDTSLSLNASLAWVVNFLQDEAPQDMQGKPGDINGNSILDVEDAEMLLKWLKGGNAMPSLNAGDVNGDGDINAVDLTLLKRELLS